MRWHYTTLLAATLFLGVPPETTEPNTAAARAWSLHVHVISAAGGPATFQVVGREGSAVITQQGPSGEWWRPLGGGPYLRGPRLAPLAAGDTLRATTPAAYPLELGRGEVRFIATGP